MKMRQGSFFRGSLEPEYITNQSQVKKNATVMGKLLLTKGQIISER
jgi:hypothetical protein